MPTQPIDALWVLFCAVLVFVMQAGFLCLESGLTRSKNAINVALKNIADFCVSFLLFWLFGFGVMFGAGHAGLIGTTHFVFDLIAEPKTTIFFFFQTMFCATSATIVSGAVAERMRFVAFVAVTVLVSGLIYPLFGHWAWGGIPGSEPGWLARLGFVDFAGSTVVHGVGSWVALAALLVIGPRHGVYDANGRKREVPGSNLPLAMLGTLVLALGWIGFNGGSTLAFSDAVPRILGCTFLAAVAGALVSVAIGYMTTGTATIRYAINGILAGLVAITAGCHAVSSTGAIAIGGIGAVVMLLAERLLIRVRIDDAVGAVPVHGAAGLWGTLAVALFADLEVIGATSRVSLLGVQMTGVMVAFLLGFGVTLPVLSLISRCMRVRVSRSEEEVGLNIAEHGASTEIFDLLWQINLQRRTGDFGTRVTADSNTEMGQIAAEYNRVLDAVNQRASRLVEMNEQLQSEIAGRQEAERQREELNRELMEASRQAGMAEVATGVLHNVGNVLNSVNVSAGTISERLAASRVPRLVETSRLMTQQGDELATFLTTDDRGRRIPEYIEVLAQELAGEQEAIRNELNELVDNIDHIKEIVSTQQSFGRACGVSERLPVTQIVEDAIRINFTGLERHGVRLVRDFAEDLPEVVVEKHKMLQILVNLISNAKHAVSGPNVRDKAVTLRIRQRNDSIVVQVIDTGVGIASGNLSRVFSHGFTTRPDGHGFGLHSSGLAAKDLHGSLGVRSDGPGQGAEFTLTVPIAPVVTRAPSLV